MIVVDASALLEALLRTPAARAVEERLFEPQQTLHAPHLLDIEVAQVIRRYPHDFLLPRVWDLRNNLTAYDAVYVALAEALDAPLLTRDQRLAAAAGHHARVELV